MAKKATKLRPWTKEDVRTLKTVAREKVKTTAIARKLNAARATHQKAMRLGVKLGISQK
jgi:predicted transcriptional regulator